MDINRPDGNPVDYVTGEVIAVDKPLGWTSFDAVKRIRGSLLRRIGRKKFKVGHAGTLDPLATGVMIICTGRATKLIDSLQAGVKDYVATIALGAPTPSCELVNEVNRRFVGPISQIPPSFSACKVNGQRAYKKARRGEEVELKPKLLVIDSIDVLDFTGTSLTIKVVCSKGTYIRALARDIGEALGSGGHLTALRRTRVGAVTVDDCLSVDEACHRINELPFVMPDEKEPEN